MNQSKASIRQIFPFLLLAGSFIFVGCTSSYTTNSLEPLFSESTEASTMFRQSMNQEKEAAQMTTKHLRIEEKVFQLDMVSTETAKTLEEMLPISLSMEDLHRNEKYVYLSEELPTAPETIGWIEKGDVLLFGTDCLVIFYESFATEYIYTRIGKIREADALDFLKDRDTIQLHIE